MLAASYNLKAILNLSEPHVMIDKLYTTPREKIGSIIGHIDLKIMLEVERLLAVFIGIA